MKKIKIRCNPDFKNQLMLSRQGVAALAPTQTLVYPEPTMIISQPSHAPTTPETP